MTVIDNTIPTFSTFLAMRLAKRSQARHAKVINAGVLSNVVRFVMHLAGFSCLTYSAFLWHIIAGFTAAGIAFFLLSWLMTSTTPTDPALRR